MKVTFEFANVEEAFPVLKFVYDGRNLSPPSAPPVDNAHVAVGAEQFSEPVQPAKRKRRTNAEIAAANAAAPAVTEANTATTVQASEFEDEPVAQTQASDFLDDDDAPATVKATKDDVRAALVGYQERLTGAGTALEAARATVLGLLKKVSGADKLGACPEDKFAAVIAAANAAK